MDGGRRCCNSLQSNAQWIRTTAKSLNKHDGFTIPLGEWHQLANEGEIPLKVVEIQYGDSCEEEDIERK